MKTSLGAVLSFRRSNLSCLTICTPSRNIFPTRWAKFLIALSSLVFGLALALPATAAPSILIEHDVTVTGHVSDRITWTDSAGNPRIAVLAHDWASLIQYSYQPTAGTTRVAGLTSTDVPNGFGFPVSHRKEDDGTIGQDTSPIGCCSPTISNLQFKRVFEGRHQAIFRYTMTYPRWSTSIANPANRRYDVPVTIEWAFSTGRDHPVWSVTWDLSGVPADALADDSRTPYGELNFSGSNGIQIAGVEWGDRYKFTTTSTPLTFNSTWTWNVPNSVPYVALWTSSVDATMGLVQTQSLDYHDAGAWTGALNKKSGTLSMSGWEDVAASCWNRTSATAPNCHDSGTAQMPWVNSWPYQAVSWNLPESGATATTSTRLTWGASYGFLGQATYDTHDKNGNVVPASGWPRQSYSLAIILGTHSNDPVLAEVTRTEVLEAMKLTASVGSVATNGPAGNVPLNAPTQAGDTTMNYPQPGYDPVRGSLTFVADANQQVTASITINNAALTQPLIVVRHMHGVPTSITLDGAKLTADTDYFASFRADTSEAWITLGRNLTVGAHSLTLFATPQFRGVNVVGMEIPYWYYTTGTGPRVSTDYNIPDTRIIDYLKSKGFTTIRLLCSWEALQPYLNDSIPTTNAALSSAALANYQNYFKSYKRVVDYATNIAGMQVIIEPWGSDSTTVAQGGPSTGGARWNNQLVGSATVSNAAFADFWGKMANHFKGNALVSYGLINEPNNMSTMTWFAAAQQAITAIRATGSKQRIFVPGNGWTHANNWTTGNDYDTANPARSNAYGWANAGGVGVALSDPANNMAVEVHQYVDSDYSGSSPTITSRTAARTLIANTVNWARPLGIKVYLGEVGMAASYSSGGAASFTGSDAWLDFVNYFNDNADTLIGYTWWTCATSWDGGPFGICPSNGYTDSNLNGTNLQNMQMLQKNF